MPLSSPESGQVNRLGFIVGQNTVPDGFGQIGDAKSNESLVVTHEAVVRHASFAVDGRGANRLSM
ncbi:hypothetical protein [Sulfurirhabdus autotrophica]|uniref:Uncharacterized protein n=1 Tax=Sulfurirhabdus autotrophica TaxID=1706046 RepID=A0A4R3XT37_9PROT|nr:hypothetical protein [Sulfurirhabdus autotrophica]TCV81218.1 hypothetical protein EDC63_1255 [Sulfurirhabdus autotrophica]